MIKAIRNSSFLDNCGIGVSLVCSIHCMAMPFILISSAFASIHSERLLMLESPILLLAIIIGSTAVFRTYFHLKKGHPIIFLSIGIALIILGGIVELSWTETALRILGSFCIVISHILNKRILRTARV
jgi:hypothetical protein